MYDFVGFDFFLLYDGHEVITKLTKFQIFGEECVIMKSKLQLNWNIWFIDESNLFFSRISFDWDIAKVYFFSLNTYLWQYYFSFNR